MTIKKIMAWETLLLSGIVAPYNWKNKEVGNVYITLGLPKSLFHALQYVEMEKLLEMNNVTVYHKGVTIKTV